MKIQGTDYRNVLTFIMSLGFVFLLGGCQATDDMQSSGDSENAMSTGDPLDVDGGELLPQSPQVLSQTGQTEAPVEPAMPDYLISELGVGPVQMGMTLEEIKAALPSATIGEPGPFMVDFDAVEISVDGEPLVYLMNWSGETWDGYRAFMMFTTSKRVRTSEGVGPGMLIADAEKIVGEAQLSYSTYDEMREYLSFEGDTVGGNVWYRAAPPENAGNDVFTAGIYQTENEYNITHEYHPGSTISAMMLTSNE